jgi:phospholipid transport system transporter-binding protein
VSIRLNTENPETWTVEGSLTFASVPEVQEKSLDWFAAPPGILDMAGVERIDSAGIALVIEWARRAKLAGGDMRLVNVPAGMTSLSKTTGIDQLLNIDSSS